MTQTASIAGVDLHPEAVRVYRERTPRSRELLARLREVIPTGQAGGMWYQLPYPTVLERGKGSHVWDVDGNEYLDFRIGDWLLIHGHCNDRIQEAIVAQLEHGVQFGAPEWDLSYRMATMLIERLPSVEKVRFAVSGTETNQIALRLARAFTGRQKMAKMTAGYHGVADQLLIANGITYDGNAVPAGIVTSAADDVVLLPFNEPDETESILERHAGELAAVLVEPVMGSGTGMLPATAEYLELLRDVTARHGIVLIFDEVVTFPIAYGGAQALYGVTPDLTTLSKSIGGGLPLGAVGGRTEIMNLMEPEVNHWKPPVVAASTFGGNQAALAAGIACLEMLTPEVHARIQALGERVRLGIDAIGEKYALPLHATGVGHLFAMQWAPDRVIDLSTALRGDRNTVINIGLALNNEGYYQFSFGAFLLSSAVTETEIGGFLAATERALERVDLV